MSNNKDFLFWIVTASLVGIACWSLQPDPSGFKVFSVLLFAIPLAHVIREYLLVRHCILRRPEELPATTFNSYPYVRALGLLTVRLAFAGLFVFTAQWLVLLQGVHHSYEHISAAILVVLPAATFMQSYAWGQISVERPSPRSNEWRPSTSLFDCLIVIIRREG